MLIVRVLLGLVFLAAWANSQSQQILTVNKDQPKAEKTNTKVDSTKNLTSSTVSPKQEFPIGQDCTSSDKQCESSITRVPAAIYHWTLKWIQDPIAVFTSLLFVVTTGLAIYTGKLWKATKTLVESAGNTAKRQLRAYISVVNAVRDYSHHGQNAPLFRIQFKNSGQTPAYDLTSWIEVQVREFPFAGNLDAPVSVVSEPAMTLGPGLDFFIEKMKVPALNPEELEKLREGNKAIYVFGRIEYRDAFDRSRYTNFCYVSRGKTDEDAGLRRHANGNDCS